MRVAIQALSAVCGGAPVAPHERLRRGARAADRARRADRAADAADPRSTRPATTDTADPLGGAYFLEALTDELEAAGARADRPRRRAGRRGRGDRGRASSSSEIEEAAFRYSAQVESGERVVVGVNRFAEDEAERDRAAPPRPGDRAAPARAHRAACAPSATPRRRRRRWRRCGAWPASDENLLPPMREALARALHGRRDLRGAPRGVGHLRRAAVEPEGTDPGRGLSLGFASRPGPGPAGCRARSARAAGEPGPAPAGRRRTRPSACRLQRGRDRRGVTCRPAP